jgi:hypothetical protein
MKKVLFVVLLLVSLIVAGCITIETPTPQVTVTPFAGVTETPTATATEFLKTPQVTETNTPDPTVTPFVLPTATATLPTLPTQVIPPTNVPECTDIPCGPNLFFNPGFEGQTTWRNPNQNENILTPRDWNFEFLTGTSLRNPGEQLDVPEAGDRKGQFYANRVDGYTLGVNDQSAVFFKSYGITDAGWTQPVYLEEGHCYTLGTSASTWANPDGQSYDNRPFFYSKLSSEDDKRNVEWAFRANFNNGPVYQGQVLETFNYEDNVYDFFLGADGKEYFSGRLRTRFCVPSNADADTITLTNLGITANNMWRWGNTDYHVDNAYLYCMDCGFGAGPTPDLNFTPTPIVQIDPDSYEFVTVVAQSLRVRVGTSIDSPQATNPDGSPKRVIEGTRLPVLIVYQNLVTGEIWAQLGHNEWIAVEHPACDNNICAVLE